MDETHFSDPTTVEARRTSFGAGAAAYDAVRPPWPEATVTWLLGEPAGPARVLDLGAGTGLGTRTRRRARPRGDRGGPVGGDARRAARRRTCPRRSRPGSGPGWARRRRSPTRRQLRRGGRVPGVALVRRRTGPPRVRAGRSGPGGTLGLAWHCWSDRVPGCASWARCVGTPEMVVGPRVAPRVGRAGAGRLRPRRERPARGGAAAAGRGPGAPRGVVVTGAPYARTGTRCWPRCATWAPGWPWTAW